MAKQSVKQTPSEPKFEDESGAPIKFFLQQDLGDDLKASLTKDIEAFGGKIVTKVPIQGFLLLKQGSDEARRLQNCWIDSNRPERFLVPYTYVEACKLAGHYIHPIFVVEAEPIQMHIHPSIANVNARHALSQRILHSGGDPTATIDEAHVVLADPTTEVFEFLLKKYEKDPEKQIESYLWVKRCIERGTLSYTPHVHKNLGGRRAGDDRTPFTNDDETNLCGWIAYKIPDKETGGRTGNKIYQELTELAKTQSKYSWANRHSWQSWRERYKKHNARLDPIIKTIVEERGITPGGKGQHGIVRHRDPSETKTPRKKRRLSDSKESTPVPSQREMMGVIDFQKQSSPSRIDEEKQSQKKSHPVAVSEVTPQQAGQSVTNPETQEDDDESSWRVRVGNDPPPAWAIGPAEPSPQRSKKNHVSPEPDVSGAAGIAPTYVLEPTVKQIAKEFRFTVEEVQEFYVKCKNLKKTKRRFQDMREHLRDHFGA